MKYFLPFLICALSACSLSPRQDTPSGSESPKAIIDTVTPVITASTPLPLSTPVATPSTFSIARGTEPFWVIQFTATGATYLTPDPLGGMPISLDYTTTSTLSGSSTIITGSPVLSGNIFSLILTPAVCSDGMSDLVYTHKATLIEGTGSEMGCAN